MIAVGEATGTLDVMLARVADCYDDEVQAAAANLLALLEPALVLFLGLVVGGLVVSRRTVSSATGSQPVTSSRSLHLHANPELSE